MDRIDWQAYLDGSLQEERLAEAESRLDNDPQARQELEALKQFQAALREQGLKEQVPLADLQAGLKQLVKENRAPWFSRPAVLAPALAACLVIALLIVNPFKTPQAPNNPPDTPTVADLTPLPEDVELRLSPAIAESKLKDPLAAAEWLAETTHRPAPLVTLTSLPGASLNGAECGSCWLAYKFTYNGEDYVLYGRQEPDRFADNPPVACGKDKSIFVMKYAVGWRSSGNMSYVLKGGTPEGRQTLAEAAVEETDNLVTSLGQHF